MWIGRENNSSLLIIGLANLAFVVASNILAPAVGWDALSWYLPNAIHYLNQELNNIGPHVEFFYPNGKQYIQPMTSSLLAAYTANAIGTNGLAYGGLFLWSVMYLIIASMIYGAVSVITQSKISAVLASTLFFTTPLIANHAVLGGYLELFLCASVVGSATLIAIGLHRMSYPIIVIGALSALTALGMKNSGFLYVIGQWVVLLGVLVWAARKKYLGVALAGIAIITALCSYFIGFDFELAGYRFLVKPEFEILSLGGRTWRPFYTSITTVAFTEIYALFINSSFSIIFLATALCLGGAVTLVMSPGQDLTSTWCCSCFLA